MTGPDNFILRWARMKRGLDTAQEPGVAGSGLPSASAATASADLEAPPARADAATAEPFDLASLPSIESIVADTDIGVFLRSGVPAELTRAALRRAWASDPVIRDFIGIAENQWDFNDPDAIPGFGPLQATDNAPAVFAQVATRLESVPEAFLATPPSVEPAASGVVGPKDAVADQGGAQSSPGQSCSADPGVSSRSHEIPNAGRETESARTVEEDEPSRKTRRHGSALPR
ncbi:MAG: hypothetical protein QOJ15_10005 [Bradyrhizobium sp.]|nr:hypothetical protein [Bradyrhizobium sp.]